MLFDIAKGMVHKVPLTKVVLMDSDLHLYLAALLVAVLYKAGNAICIPKKGNIIALTKK